MNQFLSIFLALLGFSFSQGLNANTYSDVTSHANGFVAVGSQGHVVRLSTNGTTLQTDSIADEDLLAVLPIDSTLIVAGNKGGLYVADGKHFLKKQVTTANAPIFTLTHFMGSILCGSTDGQLFVADASGDIKQSQLPLLGNIVSLSANESVCFGVTDKGEIFHSKNGKDWTVFDYNEFYKGYYQTCRFIRVLVTSNRIAVLGKQADGSPALLFSSEGSVWTQRTLNYTDEEGIQGMLDVQPNNLLYREDTDEFLLCCNAGKILVVPACSHCNKLYKIVSADLNAIAENLRTMVMVGGNNTIKVITTP